MMRLFISCFLLCVFSIPTQAQNSYTECIQLGDRALNRNEFKKAIDLYFAAEAFDPSQKKAVQAKVNRAFEKIEALRLDAENSKKETEQALLNLKNTAQQAVGLLLEDIDRYILHLEYDKTFQKCRTAWALNAMRESVQMRIWEIAYFYIEIDSAAAAISFLNILEFGPPRHGIRPGDPDVQTKLRTYLTQTTSPDFMAFLEARYYPTTILVEGGSFVREDSARVRVDSFYLAKTETTFWQYNLFARAEKHYIENPAWQFAGDNPAVNVNWYDAAFYLNWLSKQKGLNPVYSLTTTGKTDPYGFEMFTVEINDNANGYRLPTEAEWEFAARGGNKSQGFEYSGDSVLTNVAWYFENSKNRTQAVGQKKPNELGFYDMSGNVYEWCRDWLNIYDSERTANPVGSDEGGKRVHRGGCWNYTPQTCLVSYRFGNKPSYQRQYIGFRVAQPVQ